MQPAVHPTRWQAPGLRLSRRWREPRQSGKGSGHPWAIHPSLCSPRGAPSPCGRHRVTRRRDPSPYAQDFPWLQDASKHARLGAAARIAWAETCVTMGHRGTQWGALTRRGQRRGGIAEGCWTAVVEQSLRLRRRPAHPRGNAPDLRVCVESEAPRPSGFPKEPAGPDGLLPPQPEGLRRGICVGKPRFCQGAVWAVGRRSRPTTLRRSAALIADPVHVHGIRCPVGLKLLPSRATSAPLASKIRAGRTRRR